MFLGITIENKLQERDSDGKPLHTIKGLLAEGEDRSPEFKSFIGNSRVPIRRIAIPESGVW